MKMVSDFLVVGSGLAGLTYALQLAPFGSVSLLTKRTRMDANSSWAQGGIAGVLSNEDSFELHVRDTLIAGAGLCHTDAVDILVHEGPERIQELIALGAGFNMETDEEGQSVLSLGREGGHSRNRIVHTADYTGWECERTLLEAVRGCPSIQVYEHYFVTDLMIADQAHGPVCIGVEALHGETGEAVQLLARATLLATGGCGQVYKHTTNPPVATADGVAMAWRAGATIANMEFIQFHPTTLFHPKARAFLITEALRGEGARLVHADGSAFMEAYHPLKELAPRDIVARAIESEIKRRGVECVYLDATGLDSEMLASHFPTVMERCRSVDIDITRDYIPIVPAQHYQCGGVVTDLNGSTSIARLYAAGEVACTGVHGANRLASNSLLEAMVFGKRAAIHALKCADTEPSITGLREFERDANPTTTVESQAIWNEVRDIMQRSAGIVRSTDSMLAATESVNSNLSKLNVHGGTIETYEARNAIQTAQLILKSAIMRHESRGLHFTVDYPESVESELHDTIIENQLHR